MSKNNTSGFKGVHWNEQKQRWAAEITLDYKKIRLGKFRTKEEAFAAYCAAAAEHHGEFARVA